uniref:Spidroin-1-like n=1 Tax=Elaeis guineensis var. tenera TaxID=51953 RepID=A0A6I9S8Y7_ELAGV|nr:spidroin-1-like [Elaeis guineensis]
MARGWDVGSKMQPWRQGHGDGATGSGRQGRGHRVSAAGWERQGRGYGVRLAGAWRAAWKCNCGNEGVGMGPREGGTGQGCRVGLVGRGPQGRGHGLGAVGQGPRDWVDEVGIDGIKAAAGMAKAQARGCGMLEHREGRTIGKEVLGRGEPSGRRHQQGKKSWEGGGIGERGITGR